MKLLFRSFLAYFALSLSLTLPVSAEGPSVAVLDFRNDTNAYWWRTGVGRDLAAMLSNELSNTKKFNVVERNKLNAVLQEQNLGASGRVSPGTQAKIGRLTGAKYLVTATVSSFEHKVQDTGGGISFRGFSVGGKSDNAYLAVDLRVVDSTTGEVAYSRTVEGRSKGGGFSLGLNKWGFGGALKNESKTPVGKAIRAAVVEISDYLVCAVVTQGSCMSEFDAKEEKRRGSLKDIISLD